MNVSLSSIGSRGDVQPILALAIELRALGHRVVLCVAPNFKSWIESHGIEHVPLGHDVKELTRKAADTKRKPSRAELRKLVPESVRESFKQLGAASRGCDLIVVGGAIQCAGASIAELLKCAYVHVSYCPVTLPSPHHPPPMIRSQSLPRLVNRLLWRSSAWGWNVAFRDSVNAERAQLGLTAVRDVQSHVLTIRPWLAADPVLAPADPAPGMHVMQAGAWLYADRTELPHEVERFLSDGEPPIYFGFGSMAAAPGMTRMLIRVARSLERRAIVSRGWAELTAADASADWIAIGDLNHTKLFPRVAAIVHHGGAGTTTAAARAGTPQVVVPFLYDQYYWSHRVRRLGIGAAAPSAKKLTTDGLSRALRVCLDAQTAASARALASRIELDGARNAAARLTALYG